MSKNVTLPLSNAAEAVGKFVTGLVKAAGAASNGVKLDSAAAGDFLTEAKSRPVGDVTAVPDAVLAVMDEFNDKDQMVQCLMDSATEYRRAHGSDMPADVAVQALHNAYTLSTDGITKLKAANVQLDSANEGQSDPLSLQPNRAIVAVYSTIAEAIPFAHYLPADIGSNEARLGIMMHEAGNATGAYAARAPMDGTHAGHRFLSALRTHTATADGAGKVTGKLTNIQTGANTCDQAANGVKTLRGRAQVYVRGLLVGGEVARSSSGTNSVVGNAVIEGQTYVIGGTHNPDTGVFDLTTNPPLPSVIPVVVTAPIDFEAQPDLAARTGVSVDMFKLWAVPVRGLVRVGVDSQTQIANELGLDTFGESVLGLHRQWGIERHYDALNAMRLVGVNNQDGYNFEWATRSTDMTRAKLWSDFGALLGKQSQLMVEMTQDHGISHLYVGKDLMAQWMALPSDLFQPSGVAPRAGIFRFGKLFGLYDCYYDPRANEDYEAGSAQILAIGRATQVARNPVVLGDAVAPAIMPLTRGDDLKNGAGFYGRSFTEVNPHHASAVGAALIDVINLR